MFLGSCCRHSLKAINSYTFETSRTSLHAAAFGDHAECLQLLLRHDAQVNATDNSGKTALMMAAENGQAGAVGRYLGCRLNNAKHRSQHYSSMDI